MATVKGSKQYEMRVVPHRPVYRVALVATALVLVGVIASGAYSYGHAEGLALREAVMRERDALKAELSDSVEIIDGMRQELADLKVGREIDGRANEEVRLTIENLQGQVASLEEEIRFYKGVMLPNADEKGLRIERLDLNYTTDPNKVQYNLLLTQVVDKHEIIQGTVEISLHGLQGNAEKSFGLDEIGDPKETSLSFRFRYFQNLDGELNLPPEFVPQEVDVVAQAAGGKNAKLERKFPWQLNEV